MISIGAEANIVALCSASRPPKISKRAAKRPSNIAQKIFSETDLDSVLLVNWSTTIDAESDDVTKNKIKLRMTSIDSNLECGSAEKKW